MVPDKGLVSSGLFDCKHHQLPLKTHVLLNHSNGNRGQTEVRKMEGSRQDSDPTWPSVGSKM